MTSPTPAPNHGRALCNARRKRDQGLCTRPAGWGTPNPGSGPCKLHGGALPNVVKAVAQRRLEAGARDAVREIGIVDVDDPLKALARHAGEIVAVRDFLRGEVNRLETLRYQSGAGEQLRAELAAYQSALRDTTAVLAVYARLNVDERLVRISEAQVRVFVDAVNAALRAAGIVPGTDQDVRARAAVAAVLRAHSAAEKAARGEIEAAR